MTTTKFGPCARAFSCTSVRGVFERLQTHFTLLLLTAVANVTSGVVSGLMAVVASGSSSVEVTSVPCKKYL